MEATEEQGGGLLHHIIPPRLEDAGLEDCALPPDSIKEAFLKAATAVKSRVVSILTSDEEDEDSDGDCVKDPWPSAVKDRSDDVLVGVSPEAESPGACIAEKGGGDVDVGDEVVEGGGDEEEDDQVVDGSVEVQNGGKACVEGLQGLEIDEKKGKKNGGGDEDGDGDKERPILVGGYV